MGNINRASELKRNTLRLFAASLLLWIFLFAAAAVLVFFLYSVGSIPAGSGSTGAVRFFSAASVLLIITVILSSLILKRLLKILKPLDSSALLDSDDINRMIARNTAPFRRKYYTLYNIQADRSRKINSLRNELEKMYIKMKIKESDNGEK